MRTIKPFDVDTMRVEASERIHSMFKGAPVIIIKYKDTFAEGHCQYKDGTKAFFTVWYRDLMVSTTIEETVSPHEKAVEYINSIPERPWAS